MFFLPSVVSSVNSTAISSSYSSIFVSPCHMLIFTGTIATNISVSLEAFPDCRVGDGCFCWRCFFTGRVYHSGSLLVSLIRITALLRTEHKPCYNKPLQYMGNRVPEVKQGNMCFSCGRKIK